MSVLSRRHTIPAQRPVERVIDLDAPATTPRPAATSDASSQDSSRTGLIIAGAAVILLAAVGTTAAVMSGDGSPNPTAPSTTVDASVLTSEAKRDAAAASRYLTR